MTSSQLRASTRLGLMHALALATAMALSFGAIWLVEPGFTRQLVANTLSAGDGVVRASFVLAGLAAMCLCGGLLITRIATAPLRFIIAQSREAVAGNARLNCRPTDDEYAELCRLINRLLDDTESALGRQARFASEAAHELRTPLTAQRSLGELALRGASGVKELREIVASMLEEGEHMQRLIESLLTVARADGGLLSGNAAPIDAAVLAERCVRSMLPLAESKRQTLTLMAEAGLAFEADDTLIRQAILNLIHNASEHTPEGTVIDVTASRVRGTVVVRVADNGPGFPSPQAGRLIHRYNRRKGDKRARGLGMGLTIAQALVKSQGGSLAVHSEVGLGTVVEMSFRGVDGTSASTPVDASN